MYPYYSAPEYLKHLYTLDDPNASYSFDTVIVVQDTRDGLVYAAHDAGCSCPSPFESHTFPTDFAQVNTTGDLLDYIRGQSVKYNSKDVDEALVAAARAFLEQ